jgi:ribosomal protein L11 methyltransferase
MIRAATSWVEFRVGCPPEVCEGVADYLIASLGANGVLLREGAVSAYFPEAEAEAKIFTLRGYLASLRQAMPGSTVRLRRRRLAPADWAGAWKKRFRPLRIGKRLLVRPSWHRGRPAPGEVVIEIDPGQAFGTGSHASTALAMEAIEGLSAEAARRGAALDIGTGTGILAITLARLGWSRVLAVDIDPDAVAAAADNVRLNGVADRVTVRQAEPAQVGGAFDLLAANLSRQELLRLLPELGRLSRPSATLVLSGLLEEQAGEVEAAYLGAGYGRQEILSSGGWSCLVLEAAP